MPTLQGKTALVTGASLGNWARHKIFGAAIYDRSRFSGKQFTQRGLGAFDLARQNSFALYERPDHNMRIGKAAALARQSSD
jgi:hypothetical protein